MKLHRQKPEFWLLSVDTTPAYKITIVDAIFYVKKIELTSSVFSAIDTVLNDKNAQYTITRTTAKVFTVPRGQQTQHIDNAFLGEIPKRIAVCMMDNDFYNGNYKKNPFNFQHYNLTQIRISVNGEEVPFKPLKLNFDDELLVTAYSTLFSGTGKLCAECYIDLAWLWEFLVLHNILAKLETKLLELNRLIECNQEHQVNDI